IVLGQALIVRLPFASRLMEATKHQVNILNFVYWLGLLLLMFLSGAETRQLFTREERREVGWLAIVGTGIPFILGLVLGPWLIGPALAGPSGNRISLIIILAVGVAVTSVPVVSKIFADLKILHTRFARLVLGVAVLEDIVLWLALAVATVMAGKTVLNSREMSVHLISTIGFFGLGLTILPRMVNRETLAGGLYDCSSSRILCGRWGTRCQRGIRCLSCRVRRRTQEAQIVLGGARRHRKGIVRVLYSCVLRDCGIETRPGSRRVVVDDGRLHRRKLCRQDSFRITGRAFGRVPWVGSDQSRDHD